MKQFIPEVAIGAIVLTPHGEMTVVEVDHQTDMFIAQLGKSGLLVQFRHEDLEEMPEPVDFSNRPAIDQWLRCAAKVVPGVEVESTTVRCVDYCECRYCYRVQRRFERSGWHGEHVEVTHMIDAPACSCVTRRCACTVGVDRESVGG